MGEGSFDLIEMQSAEGFLPQESQMMGLWIAVTVVALRAELLIEWLHLEVWVIGSDCWTG